MSRTPWPAFACERAIALIDDEYLPYLRTSIRRAESRVWAAVFIVDIVTDPQLDVRGLLHELAYAAWRGVDVRLVVGNSAVDAIAITNDASVRYATSLGVRVQQLKIAPQQRSLHSKFVVIDDGIVVVGSHNWTSRAFTENGEHSVAIASPDVCALLRRRYSKLWSRALDGTENE